MFGTKRKGAVQFLNAMIDWRVFRLPRKASCRTFDENNNLRDRTPIAEPTLLYTKPRKDELELTGAYGAGEFFLPHGVFIDNSGSSERARAMLMLIVTHAFQFIQPMLARIKLLSGALTAVCSIASMSSLQYAHMQFFCL